MNEIKCIDLNVIRMWFNTKSVTLVFIHIWTGFSLENNSNKVILVRLYFLSTIREILKAINYKMKHIYIYSNKKETAL